MSLFVSNRVRRRLRLAADKRGKLALPSFRAARELAAELAPEEGAAELNALSLLDEALRLVVQAAAGDELLRRTARAMEEELGRAGMRRLLKTFGREFGLEEAADTAEAAAPAEPGAGDPTADEEAAATAAARPAAAARRSPSGSRPPLALVRELLIYWWMRTNPALSRWQRLLDTSQIGSSPEFLSAGRRFRQVLAAAPGIEAGDESLLGSLEAPVREVGQSPTALLRWILPRWRQVLTPIEPQLLAGLDLAAEEQAPRFPPGHGEPGRGHEPQASEAEGAGPSETVVEGPGPPGPRFEGPGWPAPSAEARYTEDRDWMPRLALVAKNALVWLQQLSREHERPISRLDEVPDEALATLARRGFSGLWLIGVWERSPASQRIKKLCGNPEAEASAYSVRGYRIAQRLGGEEALAALRRRAAEHGLRLAADMVPNHTGLDSDWVVEHPERFIGQAECPFPAYSFEGPDLSPVTEVSIQIEDHYYDRSDAAVVFRRTDRETGEVRYLYHGNDGTSTPWNDTAQLDYLRADTREAVIEQILAVARSFSVIRFDAAMTLTRQHFQRLWFPRPGDAGAIPSRAERSLTAERFDELMPREFWREVVDRVAEELPDTLLIAEAFWLLEGYFVRSLGMHRVYNSAFMHMLRDGDAAGYRKLLRETLEFDPAILERYVSFMSNPDEETAVEQFGSGDRYRGVCLLLATLPGLPMFAHGQVEGFSERYGMEYGRSYRDEEPNAELVAWHERHVAPLLGRRELFAGSENFHLFDFHLAAGGLGESVLAYTNGASGERLLAVYNHSERSARGHLRRSVPRVDGGGRLADGVEKQPLSAALPEALALDPTRQVHVLRDRLSGAERSVDYGDLVDNGLELELAPYEFVLLAPSGDPIGS